MKTIKLLVSSLLMTGCQVANNTEIPKPSPTVTVSTNPSIVNTPTSTSSVPVIENTISPTPTVTPISVLNTKQIKKVEIFDKDTNNLIDSSETINTYPYKFILVNDYKDIKAVVTYNDLSIDTNFLFKSSDELIAQIKNDRIITNEYISGIINIILFSKDTNKEIFRSEDINITSCPMDCIYIDSLKGSVYDKSNILISGAKVTAKTIQNGYDHNSGETITDENGYYKIRYLPVGTAIEVTVSKDGYKSITRKIVLKDYSMNSTKNIFNFGGENAEDQEFALSAN